MCRADRLDLDQAIVDGPDRPDGALIGSVVAATVINGAAIALWFLLF